MRRLKQISIALGLLFGTILAFGALTEPDRAQIPIRNLLVNPGFEAGKAKWTASGGSFGLTTSAGTVGSGAQAATWDSSSASQTLKAGLAIPAGLFGKSGVASCNIRTPSGTATHTLSATDTTNILSSVTITSNANYVRTSVNFVFPTSGSIELRLTSVNANEPLIDIDDCYLGDAQGYNLSQSSQATLYGSINWDIAGGGYWSRQNSAFGNLSISGSISTPTVTGQATDPGSSIAGVKFTSLPPGAYRFVATGAFYESGGNQTVHAFRFSDGTNSTNPIMFEVTNASGLSWGSVEGIITYTTAQSNITIQLQAKCPASDTCYYDAATSPAQIDVYRFPTTQEQTYTPDKLANSWSGYHDSTCIWARTNTAYGDPTADGSCGLVQRTNRNFGTVTGSNNLPSITFTPSRAGAYYVCAGIKADASAAAYAFKLWDGTTTIAESDESDFLNGGTNLNTLCGIYVATNTSSKTLSIQSKTGSGTVTIEANQSASAIEWSIFQIDQALPAPLVVNSVVSSSSGVESINRATVGSVCSSDPCTITSQSGSWLTALNWNSTGDYTMHIASGTFSGIPVCMFTSLNGGSGSNFAKIGGSPSSTVIEFIMNANGTAHDDNFNILCMGPK